VSPIVIREVKRRCNEMAAIIKTSTILSHHIIGNAIAASASISATPASINDRSDLRKPNSSIFCLDYVIANFPMAYWTL
jgi:hypothetical protein